VRDYSSGAYRRCLIPFDGFVEWKGEKYPNAPWAIVPRDRALLAFAGLWESWRDPTTEEIVRTFAIVTTEPNELLATIHDRMSIILPEEHHAQWLRSSAWISQMAGRRQPHRRLRPHRRHPARWLPEALLQNRFYQDRASPSEACPEDQGSAHQGSTKQDDGRPN
jgi:putative SOS response-associated peptidase YedK